MLIAATQKFTRQTPRKMRLVANAVRKLPLADALQQLAVIERRATIGVLKVVQQAIANAVNNSGYKFEDLALKNILVTEGSRYKRFRAVSRGRGHGVLKRTSHIRVELEAGAPTVAPVAKSAAIEKTAAPEVIEAAKPAAKKATKKTAESTTKAKSTKKAGAKQSASEKSKKV